MPDILVYGLTPAMSPQFMIPHPGQSELQSCNFAKLQYCKMEGQNWSEFICTHHRMFQSLALACGMHECMFVVISDPPSLTLNFSLPFISGY